MQEHEKKDIVPIIEDCLNVHDLLATKTIGVSAYVKQESRSDSYVLAPVAVKDELREVVDAKGMNSDLEAGTSKAFFFCAVCRSHVPTTVNHRVVPPIPEYRKMIVEQLFKCGSYSTLDLDEAMSGSETMLICHWHVEERSPATFFCALCRQHIPATVPNFVVSEDPFFKRVIRNQLLRKYCKWKVDYSLEGLRPKCICRHHIELNGNRTKTVCSLCGNTEIVMRHTTVIPSNPDEQMQLRGRIVEAQVSPERIDQMFALAQRQEEGANPLRLCEDHLKMPVPEVKPRWPRKPLTKEQKEAKSKTQRLRLQKQMAEESEAQAAERRRKAREKWQKRKEIEPEKWAEWCRKRNERRKLSRQQERKQRDEERQRRMEREKSEGGGENAGNEGGGETTNDGWEVRMERYK